MAEWYKKMTTEQAKPNAAAAAVELEAILKTVDPKQADEIRQALSGNQQSPASPELAGEQLAAKVREDASKGNFEEWTKGVMAGKLEIDFKDTGGFTLMHLAVWRNDSTLVKKLLDSAGCPLDIRSANDQTPLMFAVVKGNLAIMKLLLDRGADIDAINRDKMTPILLAVQNRQLNAFMALRSRGANMSAVDDKGCGVVHWAAFVNDVQILRALKESGVALEPKDQSGMTPLHKACMSNAYHAILFLLSQGCSAQALDNERQSPLELAKRYHSNAAVKALTDDTGPTTIENNFTVLLLAYIGLMWFTYYSFVMQYTGEYLVCSMAINVLLVANPLLYFLVRFSSPGVIPKQGDNLESSAIRVVAEKFEEGKFAEIPRPEQFCLTCHSLRPQRSKHCRYCDQCIPLQDLHCKAIGKCIGQNNRKRFLLWLVLLFDLVLLHFWLEWSYLHEQITENTVTGYCAVLAIKFMDDSLVNQAAVIIDLFVLWYLGGHVFLMLYSVSNSLTANEVLRRHRYRYLYQPFQGIDGNLRLRFSNPFFKSYFRSWTDFLVNDR